MLKVLKAGIFTTIQDYGRVGFAAVGVPVSGAMDSYSANFANFILNNGLENSVLEITFGGSSFQFLEKTMICISGGDFSPTINNNPIQLNKRIIIQQNDILSFGKVNYGVRCYLAIKGGFLTVKKLGSRSFYQNITKDFILRKNDLLSYHKNELNLLSSQTAVKTNKNHFESQFLKCYKGPEFYLLNAHQQEKLLTQLFSISKDNSRMGYKLNGILENELPQILTSAVLPGTVQLTPSGNLIVLMRDCQVTGGYPRVLQLSSASINRLAQKTTNHALQFSLIGI